jgi:threonine/homoserine/homoserine lactone efflux protein
MISNEFLITALVVVLVPGTGVIYTVSNGLFQGWRASVFAAFGCTAGIVPHLLASILGLSVILHMSAVAFQVIKMVGVGYLFFLAYSMWRDTGVLKINRENARPRAWNIGIKGFLINILNPKLSLFFLAFLPQFVPVHTGSPMLHMFLLSGIFMGMTLVVFILYGLFANSVRTHVIDSPKTVISAQRTVAVLFALLGVKLALSEQS